MTRSIPKGILAGALGGLVGSIALRAWMTAASKIHCDTILPDQSGPAHQVGSMVVKKITGQPLTTKQLFVTGEVTHYVFGAVTGAIYGGIAECYPWTTGGKGLIYGTGVFLAADETSMPAFGLIPWPWTETPAAQLEHWAAHLVFGVAGELSRRAIRQAL